MVVVQSFTRLAAEARHVRRHHPTQVIHHQFPVLNWWALVNVLTRAASTIAVIAIVDHRHLAAPARQGDGGRDRQLHGLRHAADRPAGDGGVVRLPPVLPDAGPGRVLRGAGRRNHACRSSRTPRSCWAPRGRGRASTTSASPTPAARNILTDAGLHRAARHARWRWSARPAPASPPRWRCCSGCGTRARGASRSTARTCATSAWKACAANIGVVFQESLLFNRSIRDNLLVGRPDATQEEIEQACRMADAHEFIIRQPQRLRHHGGRARHHAVRRPAPAPGDRPRAAEGPAAS